VLSELIAEGQSEPAILRELFDKHIRGHQEANAAPERIHRHVCNRMEANVPSASLWRGHAVKVVDGTGLSMPDTASNQAAYPQPLPQKPAVVFPS
jgi:hypothetical protein